MKLIRFGQFGCEQPGVELETGVRKDCSAHFSDWDRSFFAGEGMKQLAEMVSLDGHHLPTVDCNARLGAPIARPGKILGIGLNYSDHAKESGMAEPEEPIVFMKAPNAVIGPTDDIIIPRGSTKTDWEVELGVVIGREAHFSSSDVANGRRARAATRSIR